MSQHVAGSTNRLEGNTALHGRVHGRRQGLGRDGRAILARTVELDVIPRLVAMPWVAEAVTLVQPVAVPDSVLDAVAIDRMIDLCLGADGQAVAAYVAELHERGATPEALYTGLLTPVARALGEMWEEDDCSFAEVTLGVLRLQNAQRALAPEFIGLTQAGLGAPRVVLIPVPGEQHTFGLSMVMDFFSRAGWDAWCGVVGSDAEALALVRRERVDIIGLSFACDERIGTAERLIAELRRVSAHPDLMVMVGGPSFVADPGLAERLGADATALDGHQAVLRAHALLHSKVEHA